jgi:RNAse (barnase) inhibitor barstar
MTQMNLKYNLIEGNDAVSRAILMMKYDLTKTLTENIVLEQSDYLMDKRGNAMLNAAGIRSDKDYKYVDKFIDDADLFGTESFLKQIWTNWDHETASYIELGLTASGMLISSTGIGAPVGAILIGAGTLVGIADAMKYYEENRPYMGTMMLALQLIPGTELLGILAKKSPKFIKYYPRFEKIVNKLSKNGLLTDVEGKIFEWGSKLFNEHLPTIAKIIRKNSFKALKLKLKREKSSIVLRTFINFLHFGLKKAPLWIGKVIVKFGRISVTVDQLWTLMSAPDSWRRKIRNKDEFSKTLDALYDGTLIDSVKEGLWIVWQKILGNDVDEEFNDTTVDFIDKISAEYDKKFKESKIPTDTNVLPNRWEKVNKLNNQIKKTKPATFTFDDIIKGVRTVKIGEKGNVVTEIQNMLVSIGYYLGETGKNEDGIDGDFGVQTENVVKYFQTENNIKETGVVDRDTAIKLKEKYNERDNER